jgi:hypothetical protein
MLAGHFTAGEEPGFPAHRPWPHQILDMVIVDLHSAVVQVDRQSIPTVQAVRNRFG